MPDIYFPERYDTEKWKALQGVKRPYKGKTKEVVTTPTAPTIPTAIKQKAPMRVSQSNIRIPPTAELMKQATTQEQERYVYEQSNYIIANVPDYMKQMIPMDFFKQFPTEVLPEVIDTINWGLFYGDTGGQWTQGLTEAHYSAKYGLIPPDALLQKGIANMKEAGILPEEEPTAWELEQREMERTEFQIKTEQAHYARLDDIMEQVNYLNDITLQGAMTKEDRDKNIKELMQQYDAINAIQPDLSNPQFVQAIWEKMIAETGQMPPNTEAAVREIKTAFDQFTEDEIESALEQFEWQKKVDMLNMSNVPSGINMEYSGGI